MPLAEDQEVAMENTSSILQTSKGPPETQSEEIQSGLNGKVNHKLLSENANGLSKNISPEHKLQHSSGDVSPTDEHDLCSCGSENTTDTTLTESSHRDNVDNPSQNGDLDICDNIICQMQIKDISLENNIDGIDYEIYKSEEQMPDIMRLITKDLSEPYSIYTYRYFIHNWPKLCFLALDKKKCVGAIVCKLDMHKKMVRRGYIAMLAIDSEYRRKKIGSRLVRKAIAAMIKDDCDEVVLETEITNKPALQLYENLGFVRDKRLFRYYLNGVDALRLKLWLR